MINQGDVQQELFDTTRAILRKKPIFPPFYVKNSQRLSDLLQMGKIAADTPLLVVANATGAVALDKLQMSNHHIAQGEMAGEPWLVAF